ncbi:hypothetical protein N9948_00545 [bacterium]|nr:hypothetical protein [bacterium]
MALRMIPLSKEEITTLLKEDDLTTDQERHILLGYIPEEFKNKNKYDCRHYLQTLYQKKSSILRNMKEKIEKYNILVFLCKNDPYENDRVYWFSNLGELLKDNEEIYVKFKKDIVTLFLNEKKYKARGYLSSSFLTPKGAVTYQCRNNQVFIDYLEKFKDTQGVIQAIHCLLVYQQDKSIAQENFKKIQENKFNVKKIKTALNQLGIGSPTILDLIENLYDCKGYSQRYDILRNIQTKLANATPTEKRITYEKLRYYLVTKEKSNFAGKYLLKILVDHLTNEDYYKIFRRVNSEEIEAKCLLKIKSYEMLKEIEANPKKEEWRHSYALKEAFNNLPNQVRFILED